MSGGIAGPPCLEGHKYGGLIHQYVVSREAVSLALQNNSCQETPKRCKADGMRLDDTERINACVLEVELRPGKPRQPEECSGEAHAVGDLQACNQAVAPT